MVVTGDADGLDLGLAMAERWLDVEVVAAVVCERWRVRGFCSRDNGRRRPVVRCRGGGGGHERVRERDDGSFAGGMAAWLSTSMAIAVVVGKINDGVQSGSTDGVQLDPTTGFGVHDWRLEVFACGRRMYVGGKNVNRPLEVAR
nr:hypothetical protein Iba_chr03cCG6120 [Ipomoea batatas]